MAAFNFEDPRYQRDLQRARAGNTGGSAGGYSFSRGGGQRLDRVVTGKVAGAHAAHQLGRQQQFRELHLSGKMADTRYDLNKARLEQTNRRLGLREDSLGFQKSRFKRDLDEQDKALDFSIAAGILGTGFSAFEGKRREAAIEEETARTNLWRQNILDYMNRQRKPLKETIAEDTFAVDSGGL